MCGRGWFGDYYRHSLAAHGISTTHREEFMQRAQSIQERIIDKLMEPLMYRDREMFLEDLRSTSGSLLRGEFIDSYMEAAEEYGVDVTPEELSLLYTFLHEGEPYSLYGPDIRFPEIGKKWPHVIDWNDKIDFTDAVQNLSPESTIRLYHGTDSRFIDDFVKYGVDLDVLPPTMNYPEYYMGKEYLELMRKPGLYVTPNFWTAWGFGPYILEFDSEAKYLEPSNVVKKGLMRDVADPDEFWREEYPNSFNPLLSQNLLGYEPQAFLKRSLKPSDIKRIYVRDSGTGKWKPYTVEEIRELRT